MADDDKQSTLSRMWSGWPGRGLRVLFALAPLVWIGRTLDPHKILSDTASVSTAVLLLAFAFNLGAIFTGAVRWRVLMGAYGGSGIPGIGVLFRHCMVGLYYNILPGGVAGEVVRGYRVAGAMPTVGTSYAVILVERVCGLIGLLVLALPGRLLTPLQGALVWVLDASIAGAALFTLLFLFLPYLLNASPRWRARAEAWPRLWAVARRVPPAHSMGGVLVALVLSLVTQAMFIACMTVVAQAVAPEASLVGCFRVIPLITLLTYIPLTPVGLGQRDVLSLYFFGLVGIPPEQAVATSLLTFVVLLGNIVLGAVLHLSERLLGLDSGVQEVDR